MFRLGFSLLRTLWEINYNNVYNEYYIHYDIKPQNILVDNIKSININDATFYLSDFGLCIRENSEKIINNRINNPNQKAGTYW